MTKKMSALLPWLIWIVPLFLFYYVHSNRAYLFVFVLFAGTVFLALKRNVLETLFLSLLLSLPFEKNLRSWEQIVVPYYGDKYLPGYKIYFGISLKAIFAVVLLFLIIPKIKQFIKKKQKNSHYIYYLVFFFAFAVISTLFAFRQDLALNGLFRLWTSICIFVVCQIFLDDPKNQEDFKRFIISTGVFFGYVGVRQFLRHGLLGLFLESYSNIDPLGFVTTDGYEIYRVSGLMTHPTYFASFMSIIFPVSLSIFIQDLCHNKKINVTNFFAAISAVFSAISIIATFSRSAWMVLGVSVIFIVFKSKVIRSLDCTNTKSKPCIVCLICLLGITIINSNNIIERVLTLKNVWTQGTGSGRIELIRHAFKMMYNHPLVGVGFNDFTEAMLYQGIDVEYREFLYPVHNTFFLFFAELGIPAGMIFLVFVIQTITKNYEKSKDNLVLYGMWMATLSFVFNSQLHTLFSQEPSLDFFLAITAFLSIV